MFNIGNYLFWMLAACTLHHGSLAEDRPVYILAETVETKLEGKLQDLHDAQAKLERNLLAVQTKLENDLQAALNKIENQLLLAVSNKSDCHEQAANIPQYFERIGNRYFRFVKKRVTWETAKGLCREMGGYLASFRNEEEFTAVTTKFSKLFWLGINDQNSKGDFVSVASHKRAQYLKWHKGYPTYSYSSEERCVLLENGEMTNLLCNAFGAYFLCQADTET